jgi:hypothetical protein
VVETDFIHFLLSFGGEDGSWTKLSSPEEDGVERSYEELEGSHGERGWDDVEVLFVEDC